MQNIPLREALWTWCRVAALSFGGPAGQIAVMHRILVDEKKWVNEQQFLHALNYCMLLPGPEAQQLATYIGWLLHRSIGGLVAGTLFILPGFVSILALSLLYTELGDLLWVQGLFYGLKPAVIAIVLAAMIRIGKRVLKTKLAWTIAIASFVAIYLFQIPFPLLIIGAGLVGWIVGRSSREGRGHSDNGIDPEKIEPSDAPKIKPSAQSIWKRNLVVLAIFGGGWLVPLFGLQLLFDAPQPYVDLGWFFSKTACVTFGGAYAVLAYIGQQAVHEFHWLETGEMLDGLGMAETTPGPLIMVVQFVGYMAAYRNPGDLPPILAGTFGAIITTWVTFMPCFLWIFIGAPYVERLRNNESLRGVLSAITSAVVGVILNLAIWFSVHSIFSETELIQSVGLKLEVPIWSSLDPFALGIATIAIGLMFYWKRGVVLTMLVCVMLGVLSAFLKRL